MFVMLLTLETKGSRLSRRIGRVSLSEGGDQADAFTAVCLPHYCSRKTMTINDTNRKSENPRKNKGVIINVASMLGTIALPNTLTSTAYVASKHAVMGLTKTDGTYYANKDIRINAVCPGYIETPLLKKAHESELMAAEFGRIPVGRLGSMEEVASAIVFLASEMSSYMFGAGLIVDGAYTCY